MQYIKPEQYKGTSYKYSYPSDSINPKLKREQEYFLAFCQAFFADYASNNCYVPFEWGSKRSFDELEQYATGQQSSNKIKESLIGKNKKNKDGKFITKMNVSFDTYYKLPQMFDVMREKNMSQEYDVAAHCIDNDSVAAKEADKAYLKFLLDKNTKEFIAKTKFNPQAPIDPEVIGMMNASDVDMFFDTGGYILKREIACKAACQKTKLVSDYKVTQDATFDDLIQKAFAGWKTYIEKSTMLPKIRKVNNKRVLVPYSDKNDFSDITRAAELRIMSIADIRKENPKFTSADLMYLAKQFAWMNPQYTAILGGRGYYDRSHITGLMSDYDVDPISKCKVIVLDAQWLSVDIETNLKNVTGKGEIRFKPVPFEYVVDAKSEKKGDKKIAKNVIKKYHAQWIVGTDMFLDYGICKDVVYYGEDGNKTPRIDYFFVKTGNASLVERCIAIVDEIDMLTVKHRNTLATLPAAPAMAIQKDLLENVFLNGILQQPEDIVQGLIERGILYYNGLDDHGNPLYFAGGQKPIDFMDVTKIAGLLSVISNEIAQKVNHLREVVGLQNGADAGNTNPYQGLGQTQLSFQAANASLYPTFNAYNYLFRAAFDDIIKKWQIVSKDKSVKVSYSLLGNTNLSVFELDKDFTNAEFNIDIKIAASMEERQNLMVYISQQRDLGTQTGGEVGLNASEFLYVYTRIMAGATEEAMLTLAKIEKKKQLAKQQEAIQNQKMNIEDQQQSAQMKAQMDADNLKLKGEQQNMNTLLAGILKQNQMLMEKLFEPKAMGESPVNTQGIAQVLEENNMVIGGVMSSGQQEQQMPQEQPMLQ